MSLYFEERMNEQKEDDPENDKITFNILIIIEFPLQNKVEEDREYNYANKRVTSYNMTSIVWDINLTNEDFSISCPIDYLWNPAGSVSYILYSDNEMQNELYSSQKIPLITVEEDDMTKFETPEGFWTNFNDEFVKGNVAKLVTFVELILPAKIFCQPFDLPLHPLNMEHCNGYPEDIKKDFRFKFLMDSDFTIKCPNDYSMPASKMALNLTSNFMRQYFEESKENEIIVEHEIDVVKAVIFYLHSLSFKMPKTYNLDFAERLLKAIDFFDHENKDDIKSCIEQSLGQKLAEDHVNFDSILQWLRLSIQHRFYFLLDTIQAIIANKFYHQWDQTFHPDGTDLTALYENQLFRDIFGPHGQNENLAFKTVFSIYQTFVSLSLLNPVLLD
uniref:BTB domain-containing protein n=1 Tax=Panagrolaimus sp. PS1159 TaxID=55785 RepID=A0AC35FNZ3_9BILA